MKYIVILGDGMSDEPIEALGGKTPLEYANTPVMDELASKGEMGMTQNVPAGMHPGSEIANLSVLGYDPLTDFTGRSPLEALSVGENGAGRYHLPRQHRNADRRRALCRKNHS